MNDAVTSMKTELLQQVMRPLIIAFSSDYTGIVATNNTIFVIPNNLLRDVFGEILENNEIKYVHRPLQYIRNLDSNIAFNHLIPIGTYINDLRLVTMMNWEILRRRNIEDVAIIMLKYKRIYEDNIVIDRFNTDRESYLLYLTHFNNILLNGPVSYEQLIQTKAVVSGRAPISSEKALSGLIKTGALIYDAGIVSLS